MKIALWSVGKANEDFVDEGIRIFTRRLNNYYPAIWRILPTVKHAAALSENELRDKESQMVLSLLQKEDSLILLDERGRQFSSEELALQIQQYADSGKKNLVFLIGGAYGVSEELRKKALLCWSLSKLVFPHQLVRLILAEQLYRACTINSREKYHHS